MDLVKKSRTQKQLTGNFAGDIVRADLYAFASSSPAHTRLRSVRDLANDYDVSHSTIKRVLDGLAAEGVVYAVRGRGCFVAETQANTLNTVLYLDSMAKSEHIFWARRLQGITRQAQTVDLRIQVLENQGLILDNDVFLREVSRKDVCGVILPWLNDFVYDALKTHNPSLKIISMDKAGSAEDVGSVWIDETGAARTAINRLAKMGDRRIACCTRSREFLAAAYDESENPFLTTELLPVYYAGDITQETISDTLGMSPDAIIFSDDRDAAQFASAAIAADSQFHSKVHTISLANAGEDLLPSETIRLEFDGRDIGMAAVSLLNDMLTVKDMPLMSIRISPRLILDAK
ncbi:GntR family transcriptional regulator [bacterium AH-315-E10]|nr:GntR family transcriptional regulator [bacterium AH-315-E10]